MASYQMTPERWAKALSGESCPFCKPARIDDSAFMAPIARLQSSTLFLSRDQRYAGRCLLIWDGHHAIGIGSLDEEQYRLFFDDLRVASLALEKSTGCELLNVASLGNQIAHLHFHLIPRYQNDPRWGAPPWTTSTDDVPEVRLPEHEFRAMASRIASAVDALRIAR